MPIIQFTHDNPEISDRLKRLHNHVAHFSNIDVDQQTRDDLYFIWELSELLKQEQQNP